MSEAHHASSSALLNHNLSHLGFVFSSTNVIEHFINDSKLSFWAIFLSSVCVSLFLVLFFDQLLSHWS